MLLLFLTDNLQLNFRPEKDKYICKDEADSYFTFLDEY